MKILSLLLGLSLFIGVASAKEYTVVVEDTIAEYFEKSLDKDITPEE